MLVSQLLRSQPGIFELRCHLVPLDTYSDYGKPEHVDVLVYHLTTYRRAVYKDEGEPGQLS